MSESRSSRHRDRETSRDEEKHSRKRSRHDGDDGDEGGRRHSKHKSHNRDRHREKDTERDREREGIKSRKHRHGKDKDEPGQTVIDDDGEDEWVEQATEEVTLAEGPSFPSAAISLIPTSDALSLTSSAPPARTGPPLPRDPHVQSRIERDDWMLEEKLGGSSDPYASITSRDRTDPDNLPGDTTGTFVPSAGGPNRLEPLSNASATDGYGEGDVGDSYAGAGGGGGADFFSNLGTVKKRKDPNEGKIDPDKVKMSRYEINTSAFDERGYKRTGVVGEDAEAGEGQRDVPPPRKPPPVPGSVGSSWRMAKLRRTYEAAEEEGRDADELALERYATRREWEDAKEERRVLDEREGRRRDRRDTGRNDSGRGTPLANANATSGRPTYLFSEPGSANSSRPGSSRGGSFRRPGEDRTAPATPTISQPTTPIPSVFTPPAQYTNRQLSTSGLSRPPLQADSDSVVSESTQNAASASLSAHEAREDLLSRPALSQSDLNKLQAKLLKAQLLDPDSSEARTLSAEFERQKARAEQGDQGGGIGRGVGGDGARGEGGGTEVRVLPTLDGRGRLYDLGTAGGEDEKQQEVGAGNRRKKKENFETRDPKTGELLRYNADDDSVSLQELVRQQRFSAGSADQKNLDAELASRIVTDAKFQNDLEYMDDQAEKLARKKMKSEAMKKQFAIQDYARTKKVLDTCTYCSQDDRPALAPIVAMGTRSYLALPEHQELVEGHAIIVPVTHHLSSLEADDDTWDEIRNFMKTLMRMFAEQDKGVVFYETVVSLRKQKHTFIEAVPIPFDLFDVAPAYFKEAILASESEWSQHKKLIDFSSRPGGFRRAMVPNLPYFAVQWDYKGEKGYGHVIEGVDAPDEADEYEVDDAARGGGEFPRWFAPEILGGMLELEPRRWRKPKRMDHKQNGERVRNFRKMYDKHDWTKVLDGS